jgi:glycerophosphoryl diester phosphodiesterase
MTQKSLVSRIGATGLSDSAVLFGTIAPMARSRLLRIAHRGASGHCPENTRAAFVRAIELGADMVELDCQMTRDGAVVVIHDDTLDRTTSGRGRVRDHTLRELKALDAGRWFAAQFSGEEILTLEEAIEILRGKVDLNLEIKGEDAPGRLEIQCVGIVRSLRFSGSTVFSSFAAERMRLVRDLADDARIGVLMDDHTGWEVGLRLAAELGAEALHPVRSLASAEAFERAHDHDLEVRVWTVNRPTDFESLVAIGVDGIFSDYPDRLLHWTAARAAAR